MGWLSTHVRGVSAAGWLVNALASITALAHRESDQAGDADQAATTRDALLAEGRSRTCRAAEFVAVAIPLPFRRASVERGGGVLPGFGLAATMAG